MQQIELADLIETLPAEDAWLRILIEQSQNGPTLRYGKAVIGSQPDTWTGESWRYESIGFVSATRRPATPS